MTIVNTDNLVPIRMKSTSGLIPSITRRGSCVRSYCSHAMTMLNLLAGRRIPESRAAELGVMYEIRDDLPLLEETLRSQYEGNSETVEQLIADVNELLSLHDRCIQLIRDGKQEEAKTLLYETALSALSSRRQQCARDHRLYRDRDR